MRPGEIYLAKFPFGDVPGMKLRPELLLTTPLGLVPEVLVAYISSVVPTQPLPSDLLLDPGEPGPQSTNLKTPSVLRLHKLATIHCSSLARYLGVVDGQTRTIVASKLRDLLQL
ncbi:MAG: type II toxin-antitoxin system PemK/MazF family toxin [Terriglobia bacterium]|jgi:mRNA interferase MazF